MSLLQSASAALFAPPPSGGSIRVTDSYTLPADQTLVLDGGAGFKLEVKHDSDVSLDIEGEVMMKGHQEAMYGIVSTRSVNGDASALERVAINLIINATQAMESQTTERIIQIGVSGDGDTATLSVEDSGPGFPPGAVERVFERFFTTKPAGKGTGLGLWMVSDIVTRHGGTISAMDTGHGARFTVKLPLIVHSEDAEAAA